jgi:hypothetical protein
MTEESNTDKENQRIETSGAPSKLLYTIFTVSAVLGISGWLFLLSIYVFWMVEPVPLPTIKEPIPVLNENNQVAVGHTLFMEFDVIKLQEVTPISASRFLECESGNLVTLTSAAITLPVGQYTLVSDDITIPVKVSPDDKCIFVIEVTYQINPLKQTTNRFQSEPFLILPDPRK